MTDRQLGHDNRQRLPGAFAFLAAFLTWLGPGLSTHATTDAMTIAGIEIPLTLRAGEHTLVLNGAGQRRKMFVDAYIACLYILKPDHDPARILAADEPQAVIMHVTSDMMTRQRLTAALPKDLARAVGGDLDPIRARTGQLLEMFDQEVSSGDVFTLIYLSEQGTQIWHNEQFKGNIEGLDFKQALFGIWLSENPTQNSLKQDLLSRDLPDPSAD